MGQDAAPSLRGATDNRPETRVVFSSAEEARRRAVLLGALTYDEREGRGVTLVSLVPDVLAMMNVVPHGMSREQADKAFTQHDRWHLWEMEVRI